MRRCFSKTLEIQTFAYIIFAV